HDRDGWHWEQSVPMMFQMISSGPVHLPRITLLFADPTLTTGISNELDERQQYLQLQINAMRHGWTLPPANWQMVRRQLLPKPPPPSSKRNPPSEMTIERGNQGLADHPVVITLSSNVFQIQLPNPQTATPTTTTPPSVAGLPAVLGTLGGTDLGDEIVAA